MRKLSILSVIVTAAILVLSSCKKNDDAKKTEPYKCTSCTTTPDALPVNDLSSKGIYKGVVIGSSGTIKFSVQNGNNSIVATMVIDGVTVQLTSSIAWVNGQSYVAPFSGTLNGQPVSITFSVQPDGSGATITTADIPGHANAVFELVKETSNALIECFEGTYSSTKPETGTFNIILSRTLGKWGGVARKNSSNEESDVKGVIVNDEIRGENNMKMGTLNGDVLTGSFQDDAGSTVTIEGERTL